MNYRKAIREIREGKEITLQELADRMHESLPWAQGINQDKAWITDGEKHRIAKALDIPPKILMILAMEDSDASGDGGDEYIERMQIVKQQLLEITINKNK